jgi:hypothetical protein
MHLDRYIADLQAQLAASAAPGGTDAVAAAERLSAALDPALRLIVLEALSDAASEITRELAPRSVEVRLRGRDPEIVVSPPIGDEADTSATEETLPGADMPGPTLDDTSTTRTTLRLPDHLKPRVERAAAEDDISVNSWLVRAVTSALEPKSRRAAHKGARQGDSFTGWAR